MEAARERDVRIYLGISVPNRLHNRGRTAVANRWSWKNPHNKLGKILMGFPVGRGGPEKSPSDETLNHKIYQRSNGHGHPKH